MRRAPQADNRPFDASSWRIGIVVAEFNRHITQQLYESALGRAVEYQLSPQNIDTIYVAGAVELPLALQHLAKKGDYQALLAIGCVIRGDTPHFDYVCKFASEGILRVQLDHHLPIGFGMITCNDEAQALERVTLGADHLDAALQLAKMMKEA